MKLYVHMSVRVTGTSRLLELAKKKAPHPSGGRLGGGYDSPPNTFAAFGLRG